MSFAATVWKNTGIGFYSLPAIIIIHNSFCSPDDGSSYLKRCFPLFPHSVIP
jgi:hypothetical protein